MWDVLTECIAFPRSPARKLSGCDPHFRPIRGARAWQVEILFCSDGNRNSAQSAEGKDDLSAVGVGKYVGGVLLPDGRVALVPQNANHVGLYDPSRDQWTEGKDDLSALGIDKYYGGVLLPDGRALLVPFDAKHVGLYNAGGTANGATYTVPVLPPTRNALLLPYYNKF
jgi:hypothetical protein